MSQVIYVEETSVMNLDLSNELGGNRRIEFIDGDYICATCHCYVDEIDEDTYLCKNCGVVH